MDIDWIKNSVKADIYYLSKHGDMQRQNHNLTIGEVEEALLNGMILEQYADTGRGKSCLVVGFTGAGKPIHTVCGRRGASLVVITAYIPTAPKFKNPYQRGHG